MPEAVCEVCGNDYDKAFEIVAAGETHPSTASSAPSTRSRRPAHCGCRVIGHGVEANGSPGHT